MPKTPPNDAAKNHILRASEDALRLISSRGLPLTPKHYTVFFAYAMGNPRDLVEAIDAVEAQGGNIDEAAIAVLHDQYFSDPAAQARLLAGAGSHMQHVLGDIFATVDRLRSSSDAVVRSLLDNMDHMNDRASDDDLKEFARRAVETAMVLKAGSEDMARALARSQEEILSLRSDLAQRIEESERDFLTQAYNRKAWDARLAQALNHARTNNEPLCVALIDIDHFKRINDTYGHAIGDEVLKTVARQIIHSVKGKDMVARYGGEEFALLLPNTPLEGGEAVSESIRKAVCAKSLKHRETGSDYGTVSISIGVTSLQDGKDTSSALLKRADEALYAAKNQGRNRVIAH